MTESGGCCARFRARTRAVFAFVGAVLWVVSVWIGGLLHAVSAPPRARRATRSSARVGSAADVDVSGSAAAGAGAGVSGAVAAGAGAGAASKSSRVSRAGALLFIASLPAALYFGVAAGASHAERLAPDAVDFYASFFPDPIRVLLGGRSAPGGAQIPRPRRANAAAGVHHLVVTSEREENVHRFLHSAAWHGDAPELVTMAD
jgi:hypothetical protein